MNPSRTTLKGIASALGVSHTTVALALKDNRRISSECREKVKRMAKKMGYVPDPLLSALAAYRKKNSPRTFHGLIAWINHRNEPTWMHGFKKFEGYWQGAALGAKRFGYELNEIVWPGNWSPKRLEKTLLTRGIDAVLVPPHESQLDWGDFDWGKFSVIRLGMSAQRPNSNLVSSDDFRATVMALTLIHQYGYHRIGLAVDVEHDNLLGGNYYGGFAWAQEKLKLDPTLPPFCTMLTAHLSDPEKELRALERWLARHQPDAILTTQSYLPDLIRTLGYRIPQDVALAGTSVRNIPVDAGINQHSESIGTIAMETLIRQISLNDRGEPPEPCRILVESTWQDGTSLPRLRAR